MYQYDVTFIGSGHANWHAAVTLAQAGKKVAIVEHDVVAGTCTNYGCNAKYLLDTPFEFIDGLARYEQAGIATNGSISWEQLMAYKEREIPTYAPMMEGVFDNMNIDLLKGHGRLVDTHVVGIDEAEVTSDYIVIGTGQRSNHLNITGSEYLRDSRDFLSLAKMPKHITFIGAGIIAMEFATMAAKLGSEVHIVEYADKALMAYQDSYVKTVVNKLTAEGVTFHFGESVNQVLAVNDTYQVSTAAGLTIDTEYVLDATGRISNVENIGLETVGISYNRSGIEVNDHLQTTVPHVFASGDVVDKLIPRLTPTASFESDYIASFILGATTEAIQYPVVPNIVFTFPRIAQVGVSLKEANADKDTYTVFEVPFGKQLQFQTKLEDDAHMTFIVNQDKELVGASLLSNEAGDLINFLTLVINKKITAKDLNQMIFAFPGTSSGLINTLKTILR
ncbi:dihydrolipoyl dehydrogenase family protein [Lactococcus piscium]|uniref:Glutathione reductase n=1 Tax=Pseudolactococcus piscium MKFS47 TaxID=297352 RepID=A0A0D6DTW8_9LACT|nr:NAD(P)/FAD-dependent oxidoreductase [Lactococcus piscium]CEN27257.1 Glutathione reductase [Lactococcus piscium MKFS47]